MDLADVAYTSSVGRSHLEQRAALVASDHKEAVENLKTIARAGTSESVFRGGRRRAPKVAWQFTGQGAQYVGMSRGLFKTQPVFRDAIEFCDQRLRELRSESLIDVLFHDEHQIDNTQLDAAGDLRRANGFGQAAAKLGSTAGRRVGT